MRPVETSTALIHSAPTRALSTSAVNKKITAILLNGIAERKAEGGAAVLVEAHTGQIMSVASIVTPTAPDWEEFRYNRAVTPVHELGSVFKTFTIAQAVDAELVAPETMLTIPPTLRIGRFQIRDFERLNEHITVRDAFLRSSNIGSAQISQLIGSEAQQNFFGELGLLSPHPLEERYPTQIKQRYPSNWSNVIAATLSFGHGLTASPLQIAGAYSSLINGGLRVQLSTVPLPQFRRRVVDNQTSETMRNLLQANVQVGAMSLAAVNDLDVGAYGGTAETLSASGGYDESRLVSTVAAVFPIKSPKYVLVVMLENPAMRVDGDDLRTASWTVAPLAAQIIEQVQPELIDLP
jgi:cell division protein FtsI (penicillin-binding protein 3)